MPLGPWAGVRLRAVVCDLCSSIFSVVSKTSLGRIMLNRYRRTIEFVEEFRCGLLRDLYLCQDNNSVTQDCSAGYSLVKITQVISYVNPMSPCDVFFSKSITQSKYCSPSQRRVTMKIGPYGRAKASNGLPGVKHET